VTLIALVLFVYIYAVKMIAESKKNSGLSRYFSTNCLD